jgi:Helix-loop-helix DNA-binding domain
MPKADSSSPARSSSETSDSDCSTSRRKSPTSHPTKASKPRLTAHQKNTNHKDAENKRRNAIRDQFLELSRIVPGTLGQDRSEYVMLQKTVAYLKEAVEKRRNLIAVAEARGETVREEMKLSDQDWGGQKWKPKNLEEWCRAKKKDINTLEKNDGLGEDGEDE